MSALGTSILTAWNAASPSLWTNSNQTQARSDLAEGIGGPVEAAILAAGGLTLGSSTPLIASGSGSVGTSIYAAHDDHVHPAQTSVSGNAGTATALQTAHTINGVPFDGTANITITDPTKVTSNTAITGATKTKITYDSKGLVTAGADATTADISDSTNKRYVTDAQLTVLGNTSGTNSGDITIGTSNGLSLAGQVLSLAAAGASQAGAVSLGAQTLGSGTKTVDALVVTGDLTVNSTSFYVNSTTKRVGIGTSNPGGGYTGAGDMSLHVLKTNHNFVFVESLTASSDAGVLFSTAAAHADLGIFIDESDSQRIKFAVGDLDTDASRNSNTIGSITQSGLWSIGHSAAAQYQIDLGTTVANTKIALYNSGTFTAGIGIAASDVRFHLDTSTSKFSWRPTAAGASLMELSGAGVLNVVAANGITIGGVVVPTISSTSTLTNKTLSGGTISGTISGSPTLSANWNFAAFTSSTANAASAGALRLANTDLIDWRNNGNTANLPLGVSTSDRLQFNSVNIPTISSTDTLTNKTLTSPVITGTGTAVLTSLTSASANAASAGVVRLANTDLVGWRNNGNTADLSLGVSTSDRLQFGGVNVPTISSTDTFTNKTLTSPTITGTGTAVLSTLSSSTANVAGAGQVRLARADTVDWRNNGNSADLALGVSASDRLQFNSVNLVTVSSTDTMTNKTLTSPTINGAALSGTLSGSPDFSGSPTIGGSAILTAATAVDLSSAQTLSNKIFLDCSYQGQVAVSWQASGSPGSCTINEPSGTVIIGSGNSSITVTNSLASASSRIFLQIVSPGDATLTRVTVGNGSGSFTIDGDNIATSDVTVHFFVLS